MFLASKRISDSECFWPNLARIASAFIVVCSLLLDPLTFPARSGSIIIGALFFGWSALAIILGIVRSRSPRLSGVLAFGDLFFSSSVIVFCHGFSLVWLPALFLLPALELSGLYALFGIVCVVIAFVWTVVLSGLMSLSQFQQPLWWIVALLWGTFILFTATLQAMRLGRVHPVLLKTDEQAVSTVLVEEQPEMLSEEDTWQLVKTRLSAIMPQLVTAFELPFRHMGVHTDEHRQEIEAALHTLYNFDMDQEALSQCLSRLLQAVWQNWAGLAAFSPREQEILELLLQNCTYKEMSTRLHVSPSTIKTHVYHIFQKLDVSTRDEAVRQIHRRGWFTAGQSASLLLEASARSYTPVENGC